MQADAAGQVAPNAINPMTELGINLDNIQLHVIDFFNLPSPHITPHHMLKLYHKIKEDGANFMTVLLSLTEPILWKKPPIF